MDVVLENQLEELPEDVRINIKKAHDTLYKEEDFAFDANADGHYRAMWRNMNPPALWQEVDYWADWYAVSDVYGSDDDEPSTIPTGTWASSTPLRWGARARSSS